MRSLLVVMVLLGGLYGDDFRMPKTTNSLYQKVWKLSYGIFAFYVKSRWVEKDDEYS